MKREEKEKAIILRRKGLSYGEISQRLPVAKSTLSIWLRDIELTEKQLRRIHKKNLDIRRKFIQYNNFKRQESLRRKKVISSAAQEEIDRISRRELKLIGVALYWAEGRKISARGGSVRFTNSDAGMIKLIMRWFREICRVPESKFRLSIMIHDPKRLKTVERYWSRLTGIPLKQFIAPSLRISKTSQKKRGNVLPYGVANVSFSDAELFSKILGWIQGLRAPSSSPV